jgi:two-component system, LuxR family, sensor kinase FixL
MEAPTPAGAVKPNPVEMALRDSEERLRGILQTAVEGIITIDERGIMESVNPAARKLFGYTQEEMVGQNVSMLMPEPYSSEHGHYLGNYLRTGKGKIIGIGREVVGRRKDGSVFPMDLSVGEVRLAGERFFTGIVRDITERKRLEKEILEISDREQRRIGQDLHDDLCQHLAGIGLMSEVLEQKLAGKAEQESAEAGRIAARVQGAIEQTRMLARGLSPLDEMDSADLITALAELASNTTEMFRVRCRFRAENPVILGDAAMSTHLYRIAQEAISNAIRHGRADEIAILLDAEADEAVLSITDNGSGFAEPEKNHDGMGLRIMKYRAGMIGGILEVGQANGTGAVVMCRFRPALSSFP